MSFDRHCGSTYETGIHSHPVPQEKRVKPLAKKLLVLGRKLGPYLAIELLLPGGSLLALALWVYRTYFHSTSSFAGERS